MAFEPLLCRILGLGGAGISVLDRLAHDGARHEDLVAVNTDLQSLAASVAGRKIQIGKRVTRGLGAGGDPELGYASAEEALDEIREAIGDAGVIFICTGLGGGTGSGAAPLLVQTAREAGAFVVVFATMPFQFEGRRRMQQAEEALAAVQQRAHAVVCFENDRMGEALSPQAGIHEAFSNADKTVSESMLAVSAMVNQESLIQLGFDEILTVLKRPNARCLFGYGVSDSENRAFDALQTALASPLMDRGRLLNEADSLIVQVTGGPSMTLFEVQELMEEIAKIAGDKPQIMFGLGVDKDLGDYLSVMIFSSVAPWRSGTEAETADAASSRQNAPQRPAFSRSAITTQPAATPSPRREKDEEQEQTTHWQSPHEPGPEAPADEDDEAPHVPHRKPAFVSLTPEAGSPAARPPLEAAPQPMSTLARITQRVQASMGMLRHGAQPQQPPPEPPASSAFPSARHSYQKPEPEPSAPGPVQRRDPRPRPEPERPPAASPVASPVVPETAEVDDIKQEPRDEPREIRPPQRPSAAPLAPETRTATSRETPKRETARPAEPTTKQRKPSDDEPGVPLRSTKIVPVRPQARVVGPQQPPSAEPPKQEMLQFDPVNRGRFEKSEPTIVDGEDLDVPTFMRHNPKAST